MMIPDRKTPKLTAMAGKCKTTLKQLKGKTENKNKQNKTAQIKFSSFRPALSVCSKSRYKVSPEVNTKHIHLIPAYTLPIKSRSPNPKLSFHHKFRYTNSQSSTSTIHLVPACQFQ